MHKKETLRKIKKLVNEVDLDSDVNKNLNIFTCTAKTKIGWVCSKGHKWTARLDHRTSSGSGCPYCSGHKVIENETSLGAVFPQLVVEWDFEKNNVIPNMVASKTTESFFWKCVKGHSWRASVANRTRKGQGCPYCNKQRASEEYNLITEYPFIKEIWEYTKNIALPEMYLPSSNSYAYFKCSNGHVWKDKICHIAQGNRCLVCYPRTSVKRKVDETYNLKALFPKLASEYLENMNIIPVDKISPGSGKKVYWCCEVCKHIWQAPVCNRTAKAGRGCPNCSYDLGTSYNEQVIFFYLNKGYQGYSDVINRYKIEGELRNACIEVDVFLKDIDIAIEYDGYYYHKNKMELDNLKSSILNQKGITLIRVRESNGRHRQLPQLNGDNLYVIDFNYNNGDLNILVKTIINLINKITGLKNNEIEIDHERDKLEIKSTYLREKQCNSLAETNYIVSNQWDNEVNLGLTPKHFYRNDATIVNWKCGDCGYLWKKSINAQNRSKKCPKCTGKKFVS